MSIREQSVATGDKYKVSFSENNIVLYFVISLCTGLHGLLSVIYAMEYMIGSKTVRFFYPCVA